MKIATIISAFVLSGGNCALLPRLLQDNLACETALPLLTDVSSSQSILGSNVGAEEQPIACLGEFRRPAWYSFVGTGARFSVEVCGSDVAVWVDDDLCPDFGCTEYFAEGNQCALISPLWTEFNATYRIAVAGTTPEGTTDFELHLTEFVRPSNDQCTGIQMVRPSLQESPVLVSSTENATQKIFSCEAEYHLPIFYQFQGTGARFRVGTCANETNFSARTLIDDSECGDIGCVSLDEAEEIPCDGMGQLTEFRSQVGSNYTVAVRGEGMKVVRSV